MKTLHSHFIELFESGKWKYYERLDFQPFPFQSEEVAAQFVNQYFSTGGKQAVIDKNIDFENFRNIHTLSTFFLGIFLKSMISNADTEDHQFEYFWYLSCLYHDYGYFVENDKIGYPPKSYSLTKLKKKIKINYDVLNGSDIVPFSNELVKNYYKYCRKKRKFLNHGIIGGLLIYDRLRKNFNKAKNEAKANAQNEQFNEKDFIHKNLHWSTDHYEWYKNVASIIIAHNIWFCPSDEDIKTYKDYALHDLIITNSNQRYNRHNNGLLFLLCLADTIEPTKYFDQLNPICVLDKIGLEYDGKGGIICILVKDECLEYQKWFAKIKGMEKWLSLDITISDNRLEISLNE